MALNFIYSTMYKVKFVKWLVTYVCGYEPTCIHSQYSYILYVYLIMYAAIYKCTYVIMHVF